MDRRVITVALTVAVVGVAAAVTLPAIATTTPDRPGGTAATAPAVPAEMLAALSRDLNLTSGQARARLARDAWATRTTANLRQTLGTAYAGAWVTNEAPGLVVAVSDPAAARTVRAAGARAKPVARSARQLNAMAGAMDARAAVMRPGVVGWYVDAPTNSVTVLATRSGMRAARAMVTATGVDPRGVRLVMTDSAPRLLTAAATPPGLGNGGADQGNGGADQGNGGNGAGNGNGNNGNGNGNGGGDGSNGNGNGGGNNGNGNGGAEVRGGDPYIINGQARCSVGFAVTGGFVSAGHCGEEGSEVTGLGGVVGPQQAVFEASSFPEDDFSFVATDDTVTPVGEATAEEGEQGANLGPVPVNGAQEAPIGAAVCKFGSTTGVTCGEITALDVTVRFNDPTDGAGVVAVNGLIGTDVCAEPGDSGGSLLAGDQAQGVVSGGSGNCQQSGETFFQPVTEILDTLGVELVTADGDAGAGDAGAGDAGGGAADAGGAGDAAGMNGGGAAGDGMNNGGMNDGGMNDGGLNGGGMHGG
ncbi:MAG TPA: S1 family peptidase [Pilimelia sp.]|nr:S1 family peptidase [Pilimelia sp.]